MLGPLPPLRLGAEMEQERARRDGAAWAPRHLYVAIAPRVEGGGNVATRAGGYF